MLDFCAYVTQSAEVLHMHSTCMTAVESLQLSDLFEAVNEEAVKRLANTEASWGVQYWLSEQLATLPKGQFRASCIVTSALKPGRQVVSGDRQELKGRGLTDAFYIASIANDDVHGPTLIYCEVLHQNKHVTSQPRYKGPHEM